MTVLTISREIGSGGLTIGGKVADALGYQLVNKDALADVLKEYGFVQFKSIYDSPPNFWDMFDKTRDKTVKMLTEVIHAFAREEHVVIVGRGSFAVLQGYADVLNVRIKAPFRMRLNWLMENQQIASRAEAEDLLQRMDKARAGFVESAYGVSLDDVRYFDLVLDTGKISQERIVSWLVGYLIESDSGRLPYSANGIQVVKQLDVDPILADFVQRKFPIASRAEHDAVPILS